jgi:hypothetical protein
MSKPLSRAKRVREIGIRSKHLFGIAAGVAGGVPYNKFGAGLNQVHGVRAPRGYTRSGRSIPLHLTVPSGSSLRHDLARAIRLSLAAISVSFA